MSGVQNKSNLDAARALYSAAFNEVFVPGAQGPGVHQLLTEYIPASDSDSLEFVSTVYTSTVREWLGAKVVNPLRAYRKNEPLRKWEHTIGVDRTDIDYDKMSVVGRTLRAGMQAARMYNDKILFDALVSNSGEGPIGFDGVNVIDASHPMHDGTTQSNKATTALSFAQHDTIMQAGHALKDHAGQPLGINYTTLIVGPKLRKTALEIAGGESRGVWVRNTGATGETGATSTGVVGIYAGVNVFRGEIDVVLWDRLTGTQDDYYFYLDATKPYKPMALGVHRDWTAVNLDQEDSPPRFFNDQYLFSLEADLTPAAGGWPAIHAGIL